MTKEHKARIGVANALVVRPRGPDHPRWVQDDGKLSYGGVHVWVRANKSRTGICEHCGKKPGPVMRNRLGSGTEFANVSGEYRRDVDDYIELCKSCHVIFDNFADKAREQHRVRRERDSNSTSN